MRCSRMSRRAMFAMGFSITFGAAERAPGQVQQQWIHQISTLTDDSVATLCSDGSGGVVIAGSTLDDRGAGRMFVARYDANGTRLWIRYFVGLPFGRLNAITCSAAGQITLTGTTTTIDIFVRSYNLAGDLLWTHEFGSGLEDEGLAIVANGTQGVYVAGETVWNLWGPFNASGFDSWLAKYDLLGNQLWGVQFGAAQNVNPYGLASDGQGGVFMAGDALGEFLAPSLGGFDVWVARYNEHGTRLWGVQFGSAQSDRVRAAASDGAGGVLIAGNSSLTTPSGSPPNYQVEAWLARFDGAGTLLWKRTVGTPQYDYATAICADEIGRAHV